jgi:hypothetical protein
MLFAFGADYFIITAFAHVGHGYDMPPPSCGSPSALKEMCKGFERLNSIALKHYY